MKALLLVLMLGMMGCGKPHSLEIAATHHWWRVNNCETYPNAFADGGMDIKCAKPSLVDEERQWACYVDRCRTSEEGNLKP